MGYEIGSALIFPQTLNICVLLFQLMNMTDIDKESESIDEVKMYSKVLGIDEYRSKNEPMPNGIKIPKKARRSSTGGHCTDCGTDSVVGHEDGHGIWHYSCTHCIKNQNPNDVPCPRCGCKAHESICGTLSSLSSSKYSEITSNPFRPEFEMFYCKRCGQKWTNPEYERYLLTKVVRSITEKNGFSKKP
jgi:hypothetical protein